MTKNLESAVITTESGKDVKDTSQLSGQAKGNTAAQTASNSPTKYSTGSFPKVGELGGRNRRN